MSSHNQPTKNEDGRFPSTLPKVELLQLYIKQCFYLNKPFINCQGFIGKYMLYYKERDSVIVCILQLKRVTFFSDLDLWP